MTRTNADRRSSALRALRPFSPETEGVEIAMTDLVTDLRHLAASNDIDWDALVARAGRHFAAEVFEEERSGGSYNIEGEWVPSPPRRNLDWPQEDRDPSH